MKFSLALACAVAPVALAARVRNNPVRALRRDGHGGDRSSHHGGEDNQPQQHEVVQEQQPPPQHEIIGGDVLQGLEGIQHQVQGAAPIIIIWQNPGGDAATTTLQDKVTVTQTVTVAPEGHATTIPGADGGHVTVNPGETATAPAPGATHTVQVGGPAGLVFQPESLENVPIGDMVIFEFLSQNHTVTQSPFDTPCQALPEGMDSGFQANPENSIVPPPQVAMQVMVDTPLWFYCRQGNHCGQGMVMSINPTAEKTQADFKALAIAQNGNGQETPIVGGPPAAPPAGESPATTAPGGAVETPGAVAPGDGAVTPGQGVVQPDGSCLCVVSCSAGGFPNSAQGIGASGGMAGSIPLSFAAMS